MSNKYISKPNIKFKKLRNKDSYMHAFLERRKQVADFALNDKNKLYYQYETPYYILRNEEELMELKRKNQNQMNSIKNKTEFYKTYRTLKNNLSHKYSNNSSSNKVIIEKENNKYYLSQGLIDEKKDKKNFDRNLDKLEYDTALNRLYNNLSILTENFESYEDKYRLIDTKIKDNKELNKNGNKNINENNDINNIDRIYCNSITNIEMELPL